MQIGYRAGNGSSGQAAGCDGRGCETSDDEEEEEPAPRPETKSRTNEGNKRRRRIASPDHGGGSSSKNMVSLDGMMEKMSATISATMSATMSSVVASVINSSGAVYNKEREDARGSVQAEQQRREHAESQLYQAEIRMTQVMADQRKIVEEEAEKYRVLEAKFQAMMTQAMADQRKIVEEEAEKYRELEAKFQAMSKSKVFIFFI